MKRQDLSLSASHTGILWAPECDYILHTCKKPRQNLRRKKMPCRKRNIAVKEWRVRQAGKGRKHKQSWKLSVAWDCCTEQSHSCKDTQLTLEAEQPHRTNLSTHLYFCQTTTSVCGLQCHLDNVKDRQVIISGNPELGLITQCSCTDGKETSHSSPTWIGVRCKQGMHSFRSHIKCISEAVHTKQQTACKHSKSAASRELNPSPFSYPGLRMQELLSELQTWGSLVYLEKCVLPSLAFAYQ